MWHWEVGRQSAAASAVKSLNVQFDAQCITAHQRGVRHFLFVSSHLGDNKLVTERAHLCVFRR